MGGMEPLEIHRSRAVQSPTSPASHHGQHPAANVHGCAEVPATRAFCRRLPALLAVTTLVVGGTVVLPA
ncbi:MAG: hypothetical protein QOK14_1864, partial [Frankiaceae bacterium]|nr:hypothetical protein [Frankiaceae bacterium]